MKIIDATPETKVIRRFSVYFANGTAQDFVVDPAAGDTIEEFFDDKFVITKGGTGAKETVRAAHVAWMRDQTMTVKVSKRGQE